MREGGGHDPVIDAVGIVARLEALLGQERIADSYVRFRIDVALAQQRVQQAMAASSESASHDGQGALPANPEELPLDRQLLSSYGSELLAAVDKHGSASAELAGLREAVRQDPALLEDLLRNGVVRPSSDLLDSLAGRLAVSADALHFFGHMLAAPFVAAWARQCISQPGGGKDEQRVVAGSCPHCGAQPALARLRRDDGKRILYCSRCGDSREFDRMRCPFCGSADQAGLDKLYVEENDPEWIETCEQCKQYIKCFDERLRPEDAVFMPYVEETATLYLDLLAEREGYQRRLPYVLLCELVAAADQRETEQTRKGDGQQ